MLQAEFESKLEELTKKTYNTISETDRLLSIILQSYLWEGPDKKTLNKNKYYTLSRNWHSDRLDENIEKYLENKQKSPAICNKEMEFLNWYIQKYQVKDGPIKILTDVKSTPPAPPTPPVYSPFATNHSPFYNPSDAEEFFNLFFSMPRNGSQGYGPMPFYTGPGRGPTPFYYKNPPPRPRNQAPQPTPLDKLIELIGNNKKHFYFFKNMKFLFPVIYYLFWPIFYTMNFLEKNLSHYDKKYEDGIKSFYSFCSSIPTFWGPIFAILMLLGNLLFNFSLPGLISKFLYGIAALAIYATITARFVEEINFPSRNILYLGLIHIPFKPLMEVLKRLEWNSFSNKIFSTILSVIITSCILPFAITQIIAFGCAMYLMSPYLAILALIPISSLILINTPLLLPILYTKIKDTLLTSLDNTVQFLGTLAKNLISYINFIPSVEYKNIPNVKNEDPPQAENDPVFNYQVEEDMNKSHTQPETFETSATSQSHQNDADIAWIKSKNFLASQLKPSPKQKQPEADNSGVSWIKQKGFLLGKNGSSN